jgi:arylformamidase
VLEGSRAWIEAVSDLQERARIDAEYDPELSVGSRVPFLDWYNRQSALARTTLEFTPDVPYGPSTAETLDIFPSQTPGSPVLMFIHGGYWRALSSKEFSFVASGLIPHGITVAVMNYALCPQVSIADITRQSRAAVAWLSRSAWRFSGDPTNIFVAGHSAGGQQVGMLLSADRLLEPGASTNLLKGGIAISGIFDLRPLQHSWLQPTLRLTDSESAEQSPLLRIPRQASPLLATVGGDESAAMRGQTERYCAAWRAAGLDADFFPQPGLNHYEAVYGLADPASPLSQAVAEFMKRCG